VKKPRLKKYGTIKRGKVWFKLGSKQHRLLEGRDLPYTIVTVEKGKKKYKRINN